MKKLVYLCPVLLLAMLVLVGASCEVTDTTDTNTTTTNEVTTNTAVDTETAWTSATDAGTIAETDVSGTLNGEDFVLAHVQVTNWDEYYSWTFSDTAPDSECGVVMDNSAVNFSSKDIQVGTFDATSDDVEFDDYSAYYHYEQENGTPMSVNVDWTGNIVVTDFDETAGTIEGYVDFEFDDGLTAISGAFSGEVCE
ncbi:MAG: hypothetical protein ABID45_02220 [Patescibacteria group bacterium]